MTPLRLYAYAAAALAFIALFAAYRMQAAELKERTAERDTAVASIAALTTAAAGKDDTITALTTSVEAWKKLSTPDTEAKEAADRLKAAAAQLNARSRALSAREEAERASKPCAQVLAIDLVAACPAIAAGVRLRAKGGLQGSPGGNPGSRGEATP